ncbi:hypothetical protein MOO46_03960 [Apilactobacillus apisilvae]|uniref:Uncharacterized protein n=1 Tax=Apilactobacillus apisilvae TaxID=2923364 RepID=A0ABY4PFW4_9LACO|nr:hypothetical protein [Apilactobacillus apisilvae]UQS84418.1 hypothetical protein MOO46_03960 [Apilactobacillus apisilvae]
MSGKKIRNMESTIIHDMDDFLVEYGNKKLSNDKNVAKDIYNAGKNDLKGLDSLFNDQGFGRNEKFYNIGVGYLNDVYDHDTKVVNEKAPIIAKKAFNYLGNNEPQLNSWEK